MFNFSYEELELEEEELPQSESYRIFTSSDEDDSDIGDEYESDDQVAKKKKPKIRSSIASTSGGGNGDDSDDDVVDLVTSDDETSQSQQRPQIATSTTQKKKMQKSYRDDEDARVAQLKKKKKSKLAYISSESSSSSGESSDSDDSDDEDARVAQLKKNKSKQAYISSGKNSDSDSSDDSDLFGTRIGLGPKQFLVFDYVTRDFVTEAIETYLSSKKNRKDFNKETYFQRLGNRIVNTCFGYGNVSDDKIFTSSEVSSMKTNAKRICDVLRDKYLSFYETSYYNLNGFPIDTIILDCFGKENVSVLGKDEINDLARKRFLQDGTQKVIKLTKRDLTSFAKTSPTSFADSVISAINNQINSRKQLKVANWQSVLTEHIKHLEGKVEVSVPAFEAEVQKFLATRESLANWSVYDYAKWYLQYQQFPELENDAAEAYFKIEADPDLRNRIAAFMAENGVPDSENQSEKFALMLEYEQKLPEIYNNSNQKIKWPKDFHRRSELYPNRRHITFYEEYNQVEIRNALKQTFKNKIAFS